MAAITLEWDGKSYSISENEAFEVGERIEEIVTLSELAAMGEKPKFFKLARCYAEMLNFAGANVTPRSVHDRMMNEIKQFESSEQAQVIAGIVGSLIAVLMDGAPETQQDDAKKKSMSGSLKAAT